MKRARSRIKSRLNKVVRDYFNVTHRHANGLFVLFALSLFFTLSPLFFPFIPYLSRNEVSSDDKKLLDSLVAILDAGYDRSKKNGYSKETAVVAGNVKSNISKRNSPEVVQTEKRAEKPMSLNKATVEDITDRTNIPDFIAIRIIAFRSKLRGFYTMNQLNEVYGIRERNIKELRTSFFVSTDFKVNKILINSAEFKEILSHHYFNYDQTKAIFTKFRNKNKTILGTEMLVYADIISNKEQEKYLAYLSFE